MKLHVINKNKRKPIFNKRILNNIQYTMYIKQKTFINKKCANNLVKCVEVKWGEVQGMEVGWRLAQRDGHAAARGAHEGKAAQNRAMREMDKGINYSSPTSSVSLSTAASSGRFIANGLNRSPASFTLFTFSKVRVSFSPFWRMAQARGCVCTN